MTLMMTTMITRHRFRHACFSNWPNTCVLHPRGDGDEELERWCQFLETMAENMDLAKSKDMARGHWIWKAEVLVDTILIAEVASSRHLQDVMAAGMK